MFKWTASPWALDAVDDDSAKEIESEDVKQHASAIVQLAAAKSDGEKTKLVQVAFWTKKTYFAEEILRKCDF